MSTRQASGPNRANRHQFSDLKTVLAKYFYHWPLFVLCLIIAFTGAYFYLQNANPAYEVSATILVKDEKKSPQEKAVLPELEQSSSPKNAESEIEILRSKKLVSQVVNDLQLWTTYKVDKGLTSKDLYENPPFKFVLLKKGSFDGEKMEVLIKDNKHFEVENLNGNKQTVAFNQSFKNSTGTWLLKPTNVLDQYIGSVITVTVKDPEMVSNAYIKSLDAHLLDKLAPTIGLFITDEVPQRGLDFLNSLITAYNDAASDEQKRTTKSTIDFIDRRLASLTGELNTAEKQVEGYRSSQGLTDINSQAKVYLENVQANDNKLNEVNVQLNVIAGIEQYVNSPSANATAPATIGISDPALNSQIEKLSELQLKRSALLATTPENNPLFEPINKQIAVTKAAIRETVSGVKASLLNSKRELQAVSNKTESSIKDIPVQERQFVGMKRQQSIKENLYVYLLQKREELALSYASTFVDARIVDKANIGDKKWPKPPLIMALALLLGIGVPFMIIYFRQSFNNKITGRRDIEKALNVPILAELSYNDSEREAIVVNTKHHLVGEQFRTLRTNLNYLHSNLLQETDAYSANSATITAPRGKVTMLTSSVSKEGKSFVSSNLAASLAASGKKTVILEMDLRKPKITRVFDLPSNHPGISEYLSKGNVPVESIIQHTPDNPGLDVIGVGQIPLDPSELLEREGLTTLINDLRNMYDDVVIDTAPLHLVTDAMIIAKQADVCLYIIRQGYTTKDELDFLGTIVEANYLPSLQIVFNGIKKNKYGYGYNYDNSYYSEQRKQVSFKRAFKGMLSRF
ncbi:GumC family protein [Mucilaginibacter aquatilis]|uniref:Polysaccharide biosynthesis tyrosine autokinase n=1 Tax=Mucilaginibacter aquatilis TaxID=1517760 RepID=A0A6I4I6A2_9SPHI|nr:tyrosine-protein kinase family protein [Mucilaginibacter aquatilis]MVN90602.1 polysaccharide biosynthesis tyrosine autokinase [Mucilaginibacter aquatilis]